MKIPATLVILLVGWVATSQVESRFLETVREPILIGVAALLAVALLASLAGIFTRAGRIFLEDERLVVRTPTGFCKIPYSRIETIRRCRRKGKPQHLQIIFQSLGKSRMLQIRPPEVATFTASLRRKCPHLSSSSDSVLVRKSGEGKLIHSALVEIGKGGRRRSCYGLDW